MRIAGDDAWAIYRAFEGEMDNHYVAHIVDGAIDYELMGTGEQEGHNPSIAVTADGEPHVLINHGAGHRYYHREAGVWVGLDLLP